MSTRQWFGTLSPSSSNGLQPSTPGETPSKDLIRAPFVMIYFFTTFAVLSYVEHKEMRFITTLV